ncbi:MULTISPECIES: DNA-binding response regulator [Cupriavidus]
MTTLLLAHNMMLRRGVLRQLRASSAFAPVLSQTPEWLLEAAPADLPRGPIDFALLDCSGTDADPFLLLNALSTRLAPRRWLVMSETTDPAFTGHAAHLGASGCLAVPASLEQTRAAVALVRAGGQCFPRRAFAMPLSSPIGSGGSTARG